MNVLLIWPEFPVTYWGGQYGLKLIGKKAVMPPLGLLTVAALCPPEWNLRLVDLNIEPLSQADLKWADLALISGMVIQHNSIMDTLRRCREAGVPAALGGPHATSSHEKFTEADYLVLDEGEITFPMFLSDLAAEKTQRIYRADGEKPDLTKSPIPRFDLLKMHAYIHMCVQFSRGCPFACEFCDITTLFGRTPRTKAPAQLLAELDKIYALGFRGEIFIVDDNFVGNKKNVKALLSELIVWMGQHDYPFSFYTEASLNLADDHELLELMREAGFYAVFMGIETPSEESLRQTKKYQNLHGNMLEKVQRIQSYGMEVMAGFIVGFDQDTEEIFERQIEFITAARIPMAMVGPLNAMPNTQLWHRLEKEGRLNQHWTGDTFDFCNFETTLPPVTLARGYRTILATLYDPANFFSRLRELVNTLPGNPHQTLGRLDAFTRAQYYVILLGALFWISIADGGRYEYWRFLSWVFRTHRQKFLLALCRTIIGYHFIQYTSRVMVPRLKQLEKDLIQKQMQEEKEEDKEKAAAAPQSVCRQ
jgi:radical SAM superfamily enzyme YgiQ (UPF0313 family)